MFFSRPVSDKTIELPILFDRMPQALRLPFQIAQRSPPKVKEPIENAESGKGDAERLGQSHEIQGTTEAPLVLPNVLQAVPRPKRV